MLDSWVEGFCECTNSMYFYMHSSMSIVRYCKTEAPPKFRPVGDHLGDRLPTGRKRSMPD